MLTGRGLGGNIDKHEAVLRINQAPVQHHEGDVGARTSLRLVNNVWAGNYAGHPDKATLLADLQAGSTVVATRANPHHFQRLYSAVQGSRADVDVALLSVQIMGQMRELLESYRLARELEAVASSRQLSFKGGTAPSTGFVGLYTALATCSHVTAYGFSRQANRNTKSSSYPYHYFKNYADAEELRAHPHHSFTLEGDLLMRLFALGALQVCEVGKLAGLHNCSADTFSTSDSNERQGRAPPALSTLNLPERTSNHH